MKSILTCLALAVTTASAQIVVLPHAAWNVAGDDVRAGVTVAGDVWSKGSASFGPSLTVADTGTSDPLLALEARLYFRKPLTQHLTAFTFFGGGMDGVRHYEGVFSRGAGLQWRRCFADFSTYTHRHHTESIVRLGLAFTFP